jgi:hypothetical protein
MAEFINRNLENREPEYFYAVVELVTTFGLDKGKNEPFSHRTEFKGNDLLKCKSDAEKFYFERLEGFENGQYFLPYAAPKDFVFSENAASSILLVFETYYGDGHHLNYSGILLGEDEEVCKEERENEQMILAGLGFNI